VISFAGSKGSLKLFVDSDSAVVVDTSVNMIVGSGDASAVFASYEWDEPTGSVETSVLELASSALTTLDINVITASGRMYTIPDGVKSEAKKALEWRKEEKRGGTPVGLNTARTLAKGGQIGIEKIRHIAKYFPRHEVDKKGKGWKPGTDNFPSNGRIAWALWGGDAAWRWASAIVERENKKSLRAGGYATPGYDRSVDIYNTPYTYGSDMDSFKAAYELDPTSGPEFMTRVRLDGSGFDRLYKIETDGRVCVWDDGRWDDLGHVDGDVWSYDSALDDEYDDCEKDHVIVDPQTAMLMSAMWQDDPYRFISIDDIDPEEASLVREAYPQEDWKVVDYVITAAAVAGEQKPSGAINPDDNIDTPAEKSMRSASQQRDATGKFAQAGGRVVVGGDTTNGRGTLLNIGPSGMGKVQLDNGRTVDVPVKLTKPESEVEAAPVAPNPAPGAPLDVEGILGEPRTPKSMPGAQLPGTYPPMGASDLKAVVNDWGNWVNEQRAAFKPVDGESAPASQKIATVKDGKIVTQKMSPTAADRANAGKPVINPAAQNAKTEAKRDNNAARRAPAPATPKPASNIGPGKIPAAPTPKPAVPAAEARKDKAAAGRGPAPAPKADPNVGPGKIPAAPTPKPAVPSSEARRDKAAAGRGPAPAPKPNPNVGPGKIPAAPAPKPAPKSDSNVGPGKIPAAPKPVPKDKRNPADAGKYPGFSRDQDRKAKGLAPAQSEQGKKFDDKGRYVIQKGDSLWSIADKNKPAGKSTAEYWNEVMKANPKDQFKSGNPSLIYSGERVSLPGVTDKAAPKKPNNQETLRNAKNAERKAETSKAAASAKAKADAIKSEARRDKATAGRAPTPSTEARRDSAAAGRAPAPKPDSNVGPGKIPAAPKAKPGVPAAEAKKDKAAAGRGPAPKPGTQGPSPRAADKANEGKTTINTGAQTAKAEARRDKATAGRAPAPAPKPAATQKPSPRAADKANEGKPVINTGAQTAKTEAKRDKTSAGRAPAPKPAPPTTTPRAADKANEGKPVINTGAQAAKTEAKRDRNRGTAGTRKRK
jgi:hypothetical protein